MFLYGGSILPGRGPRGEALDIVSVFEAVGARAAGKLTDEELSLIERSACPTIGSCAGMFTANTMASVSEALGMALPGSASPPAVDPRRDDLATESGQAVVRLLEPGIRPRQIMTKEAFENAIAVTMALGGSTNAVLHLLAIAYEARVELTLDDFDRIGRQGPSHRRHQAARPVPHGRPRPHRRSPGGHAGAARSGPPARGLPDRHRPYHRREPGLARARRRPMDR